MGLIMKNQDIKQLTAVLTQLLNKLNEESETATPTKTTKRQKRLSATPARYIVDNDAKMVSDTGKSSKPPISQIQIQYDSSISTTQPPEYVNEPKPTEKIPIRELLARNLQISSAGTSKCPRCDNYLQDTVLKSKSGLYEAAYECIECHLTYEYDRNGMLIPKKVL